MTADQHKVYNVQDVIDFVTKGDISGLLGLSDDDSDKDMPYIPPTVRHNFNDDKMNVIRVVIKHQS